MDNAKLAKVIYSIAQYEGYNTSELQTQKNLATDNPAERKFAQEKDEYIFDDLVKAMKYASAQPQLSVEMIKGINKQMDSKNPGQPEEPGELRVNKSIHVGDYFPRKTVTQSMVQKIIDSIDDRSIASGWSFYAKLAKLQPFDNGNKRTAMIAANYLTGALTGQSDNYLWPPVDYQATMFNALLTYYYMADIEEDSPNNEFVMLRNFVDFATNFTRVELSKA